MANSKFLLANQNSNRGDSENNQSSFYVNPKNIKNGIHVISGMTICHANTVSLTKNFKNLEDFLQTFSKKLI